MRYDAQHKQRTRETLLRETAKAIRDDGPHKVSVADIMGRAGLTHGGFYAHFANRDALIAEGVDQMFRESGERMSESLEGRSPRDALADYLAFYLSPAHRDTRTSGCPLTFLSVDAPRLPEAARERFAAGRRTMEARLSRLIAALGLPEPDAEAASLVAELVGAVTLARAEPDTARAHASLAASQARLRKRFGLDG